MPKIHDMIESKFLKKEDVGTGVLLTINGVIQKNVAKEGADPENKWCLTFIETDKPLVLNSTNIQLCQVIFGSDDTDDWLHKSIVLYTDPTVSYGGKIVGGIRVRKPKIKPQPMPVTATPAPQPPPVARAPLPPVEASEIFDDEIPF